MFDRYEQARSSRREFLRRAGLLGAGVAAGTLLGPDLRQASALTLQATPTQRFLATMGVAGHLNYLDGQYADFTQLKAKLSEIGIKHWRDQALYNPGNGHDTEVYSRMRGLGEDLGVKFTLMVSRQFNGWDTVTADKLVYVKNQLGGHLEAFEGPNEPDINWGTSWAAEAVDYQKALWRAAQDSRVADIPLISFPLAQASSAQNLPNLDAYCDYGGLHPYQGGRQPENDDIKYYSIGKTRPVYPTKMFLPTETGYHNAINKSPGGHFPTSERAVARYMGRLYFVNAAYGFKRSHVYQFLDNGIKNNPPTKEDSLTEQEASFGMIRQNWSNKPHFNALRNTITLLKDGGSQVFAPGSLGIGISGDTTTIRTKLLRKSNKEFWLAIWQEISCWERDQRKDIINPALGRTLSFSRSFSRVNVYWPTTNGITPTKSVVGPVSKVGVSIPDHVCLVRLKP